MIRRPLPADSTSSTPRPASWLRVPVLTVVFLGLTLAVALWLAPKTSVEAASQPQAAPASEPLAGDICTSTGSAFGYPGFPGYVNYGYPPPYLNYGGYPYFAPYYPAPWPYIYAGPIVTITYPCNAFASCVPISEGSDFVICPGPAASVSLTAPTSVSCGGASNISAVVKDSFGRPVSNNTEISFQTTLGYVSKTASTDGGSATTSLTIPPKTSGSAVVTATVDSISSRVVIQVTC